jgi:transitional endoplasmic reticulum ATPase
MSLEDSARKEILKKKYRKLRSRAENAREDRNAEKAADYYRRSAEVVDELADLESSQQIKAKREELATNLRDAAEQLEAEGFNESKTGRNESADSDSGGEDSSLESDAYLVESPDITFEDVGGMDELKETLTESIIDPLDRPELYDKYGLGTVKGVLLYGPPGTGKTYITRALAGKLDFNYIELEATDLTSSLVGEAADNVAEVFEVAKENQPCLVFLDEIDAITAERSGGNQKTMSESQMITQFLTEMSSIADTDVVFIAATNLPDEIDGAAWRRFDKRIEVPPPEAEGRRAVLRKLLEGRPVDDKSINWAALEPMTDGYTPSDLELVVNEAARAALSETDETGDFTDINQRHIEEGLNRTNPSLEAWDHN